MIELKHLKTLLALENHHSVHQAAEALFTTQSALSHQIKQLEAQLGLTLFERKTRPVRFTPAGQTLLNAAHEILPRLRQTETLLQALKQGEQGRLLIGVDCHTCFEWLLPMLRPYQQKWHNVDLDILNSFGEEPLKKLRSGELDLVITSDPEAHEALDFQPLFSYELKAVLPPAHPLSAKEWLEAEDLTGETLIVYPVNPKKLDVFRRFLDPQQVQPYEVRHSELTLMMLQLTDAGRGLCVLPQWLIDTQPEFSHLTTLRLGPNGLWSTLYAATRSTQSALPYIQDFIRQVKEAMAD